MAFKESCRVILAFLIPVLLTGCAGKADMPPQLTTVGESVSAAVSVTLPETEELSISILFDEVFLPFARSGGTAQDFRELTQSWGFSVIEENGVLLVYDREVNGCFLRAGQGEKYVEELVFCMTVQDVERQVKAVSLGDPQFATGVSNYQEGTPVSSEEEVWSYLAGPLTQEEKAPPDVKTALSLFHQVFLPLAEGELSGELEPLKGNVEELGFFWTTGEGQYCIVDPDHPENFIWLEMTGEPAHIRICGFSMSWEGKDYQVCIVFQEDGSMDYYKDLTDDSGGQKTANLDYLKEFIYKVRG